MDTGPEEDHAGDLPTGHLPHSGLLPETAPPHEQPPPEKSRGQRSVVLGSIVTIVAVVAAVLVVVLTHRGSGGQAGKPAPAATTPAARSGPVTSSRTVPPSTTAPPDTKGWHRVAGTSGSGLTYSVPPGWADSAKARTTGRGEQWSGVAQFGVYQCPGGQYTRGFVASGKPPTGDQADLAGLARGYAKALAAHWYTDPRTEVGAPQPREVGGHHAVQVTVKLTITPQNPRCDASTGEVVVLAVQLDRGVGVLAAVNDLSGGPSDPPCAPDGVIEQILGTADVR